MQLQQANVKIMELYNKVGEMERDKLSVENAQAMVKTLDKVFFSRLAILLLSTPLARDGVSLKVFERVASA